MVPRIPKIIWTFVLGLVLHKTSTTGKMVLQDVLWSKDFDYADEFDDNYFGACRFTPSPCSSAGDLPGVVRDGVCVKRNTCSANGGQPTESICSDGFGECCIFTKMCNGTRNVLDVDDLVTVITSPSPIDTECAVRFRKEPRICQIRLDFLEFTSAQADADGICEVDRLRISNTINVPRDFTTCGALTGQHMYLTFGSQDMIEITPVMRSLTAKYKIVATRIPCNSKQRAPDYCLQYHTSSTGIVRSFDWGGQQQSNQRYSICVEPSSSSSSIMWKTCAATGTSPFDIITNPQLPKTGDACTTDWVQPKGSPKQCDHFVPTTSTWKPYELLVNLDKQEIPPPPPSFNVPVNASNCAAECAVYDSNPSFSCGCNPDTGNNQVCVCLMFVPAPPGSSPGDPSAPMPIDADFNNVGFCLEYMQL